MLSNGVVDQEISPTEYDMTAVAVTKPALEIIDGHVTTTSLQIAEHFDKRHDTVLRAITRLECSPEFTDRNFAASDYTDSTGRKLPCYRITRDGFVFLAMGFTGKDAARWKEAYIDAFNQMEAALLAQAQPATITAAQQQHLKELVDLVVESGKQKSHAETWARLHRKFSVPRYQNLPAEQFDNACQYLRGKLDQQQLLLPKRALRLPRLRANFSRQERHSRKHSNDRAPLHPHHHRSASARHRRRLRTAGAAGPGPVAGIPAPHARPDSNGVPQRHRPAAA
ncbi:MAG: Rha family transcriptional regulator [Comamonadaceae bacterium]|nr:Rha family transcriptional regulator [Comamonadaceae bacterium]